MTHTIAVCTVKNFWRWTEELSDTRRVLFQKEIWEISSSTWFYYKNLSQCTVTWTSNFPSLLQYDSRFNTQSLYILIKTPPPHFCGASNRFLVMFFPYEGFMITLIEDATIGRTPLDERSAQRRDLYRATHNNHMTQIPMPLAGFELTTPTSELLTDPRLRLCDSRTWLLR